jgi:hypothetical protein
MVKKCCISNPNEATDEFDYAPSRPEKVRMNLSHAAVVKTPVPLSEYSEAKTENIDLTSEDPSMLNGFTNAYTLLEQ